MLRPLRPPPPELSHDPLRAIPHAGLELWGVLERLGQRSRLHKAAESLEVRQG
jgi:hypothetical protein